MEVERAAHPEIEQQRIDGTGVHHRPAAHRHDAPARRSSAKIPTIARRSRGKSCTRPRAPQRRRRRARARANGERGSRWADRLAPEFMRIHPIAADLPQECIAITAQVFMSIQFHTTHDVRVVPGLVRRRAAEARLRLSPALFAAPASEEPGRPLGAQSAGTLVRARGVARTLPRRTHHPHASRSAARDGFDGEPRDGAAPRIQRQRRPEARSRADWADRWARALETFLAVRDRAPAAQFLDVGFDSIEKRSARHGRARLRLSRLAADCGRARARCRRFSTANPKNKHGVHRYTLEQFGLSRAERGRPLPGATASAFEFPCATSAEPRENAGLFRARLWYVSPAFYKNAGFSAVF